MRLFLTALMALFFTASTAMASGKMSSGNTGRSAAPKSSAPKAIKVAPLNKAQRGKVVSPEQQRRDANPFFYGRDTNIEANIMGIGITGVSIGGRR